MSRFKLVNYGSVCKDAYGYNLIKVKNRGWIKEHRYIMELFLERKLEYNEDVHHINRIRDDNRIKNLEILTHGEHSSSTHKHRKHKEICGCFCCRAKRGEYKGKNNSSFIHGESNSKAYKKELARLYYIENREKIKKDNRDRYYINNFNKGEIK